MRTLSLAEAETNLSGLIDTLILNEGIMLTKNGRPAAVLISPDEFESWKETFEIRSDPNLMKEIREGLEALGQKKAQTHTLEELFNPSE